MGGHRLASGGAGRQSRCKCRLGVACPQRALTTVDQATFPQQPGLRKKVLLRQRVWCESKDHGRLTPNLALRVQFQVLRGTFTKLLDGPYIGPQDVSATILIP